MKERLPFAGRAKEILGVKGLDEFVAEIAAEIKERRGEEVEKVNKVFSKQFKINSMKFEFFKKKFSI